MKFIYKLFAFIIVFTVIIYILQRFSSDTKNKNSAQKSKVKLENKNKNLLKTNTKSSTNKTFYSVNKIKVSKKRTFNNKKTRKFPVFLIIGEAKCGTGTLLDFFDLHPDVSAPKDEVNFFNKYYYKGLEWYRKQMPLTTVNKMTYEKTPFFSDKRIPKRVYKFNSSIKLVVMFREPVNRTVSGFTHAMSRMNKKVNPNKYDSVSKLFEEEVLRMDDSIINSNLIRRGRYIESYKRWLEYFPKEQILIINGENFVRNPYDEIKKMERFLGLTTFFKKENFVFETHKGYFCLKKNLNSNKLHCMKENKGRDHPFISKNVLVKLRNYFAPYDRELFEFIREKPFWNI